MDYESDSESNENNDENNDENNCIGEDPKKTFYANL